MSVFSSPHTTAVKSSEALAETIKADVLLVPILNKTARGKSSPALHAPQAFDSTARSALTAALKTCDASTGTDVLTRIPAPEGVAAAAVAFIGVDGNLSKSPTELLRRAAGAGVRQLAGAKAVALALAPSTEAEFSAVAEGALMGNYSFGPYRSQAGKDLVSTVTIAAPSVPISASAALISRAQIVARAIYDTRDLINTAPSDLYPSTFASHAEQLASDHGLEIEVLDEQQLREGGYGGLIGVGQGSARPPRLVKLSYQPQGATRHLSLVGKGITFDSGGLSLKPALNMDHMKSDMSGAAAVLNTIAAISDLKLPIRVTAWLALAENMPSGSAQRPSDILTMRGGKTVEVLNTDAEGRLVLADALTDAGAENPDVIIDVATLTGAQVVALGNRISAVISDDDELSHRFFECATEVGEQFWPMPLPMELRPSMDSRVADIANIGERMGGMLTAAVFLREFVPTRGADNAAASDAADAPNTSAQDVAEEGEQIPWLHLDIAGPAFNTNSAFGYTPLGGTGVSVRAMIGFAESLIEHGI